MIHHGRKFTNATDTGKLCSVNLTNCKEGHSNYCKVSEIWNSHSYLPYLCLNTSGENIEDKYIKSDKTMCEVDE